MKNTFGNNLSVTIFGESHGAAVGCVMDGIAPGIEINMEYINASLSKRAARSDISTPRQESDEVEFLSGVKNGFTEGTPICLIIKNQNKLSSAYSDIEHTPRPSHADLTAEYKYHGFQDKAGGGHFSGRVTAALVAAGAIVRYALSELGIKIGTHIKTLYNETDVDFSDFASDVSLLETRAFPTISEEAEKRMKSAILNAKKNLNSVGGVLETAVINMPEGVGEPWFDTAEGIISHAIFSIPGVKGIEFGAGFSVGGMLGSEANAPYAYIGEKIVTTNGANGGICGGITDGTPIVFRTAIKPTPSIAKTQNTVNLKTGENTKIEIQGRHDPAIIHRASAVVDAVTAIAIGDLLITRYGTDFLRSKKI